MEITGIEAIPIEVDFAPKSEPNGLAPYRSVTKAITSAKRTVVKLHTDTNVVGYGEILSMFEPETMVSILENDLQKQVVGTPVENVESLVSDPTVYYMDWYPFLGGVEMAAYDALGKHLGEPVSSLIGGRYRSSVDCSYCVGVEAEAESRQAIASAHEQGFTSLKTKVGGDRSVEADVDRIAAMYDEVDGAVGIRTDAVKTWSVEDVLQFATELERRGVYLEYIEQPLPTHNFGAYESLRERLRTPLAIKEDLYYPRNLSNFVRNDAIDVGVVDVVPAGGITAVKKLAGIAGAADISLAHHCGFDLGIKTAAVLHTVASTPELSLPADTVYYGVADRIVEEPFEFDEGSLAVPEGPGLGVTVDEGALERVSLLE